MLIVKTRGLEYLSRIYKTESKRQEKALNTAIKVEGFRLMRLLKEQIKAGAPGGRKFDPLTYLSRAWSGRGKRLGSNKALRRLAIAVRYLVKDQRPFDMRIGWVGLKTSKSWKRIAQKQQEGFEHGMSDVRRAFFASKGAGMSKRSVARKYMFLRKSTTQFKTPARPILDPFWRAEKDRAWHNIRRNYLQKLAGETIAKHQYKMRYDYKTDTFTK
jgi:hypothetical protein